MFSISPIQINFVAEKEIKENASEKITFYEQSLQVFSDTQQASS